MTRLHTLMALLLPVSLMAQLPEPDGAGIRSGTLPSSWITGGPKCMEVPDFQVHEYNPDFYILRESGCINYEKPFLYLFFGKDKALLVDTGAGVTEVAHVIDGVMKKWLQRNDQFAPDTASWHHMRMDGMLTDAQLAELDAAKGVAFDRAFLNLMIQHHTGALKMVDDLFASPMAGQEVDVSVFANDIVTAQTSEIAIMKRLLTQLPPK